MDPGLNLLVREAGKHMDRFSRIPGWSVALEGLIRTEALGTTVLEHQTRLLAHLVGRTTESERRQRREPDSRREKRAGSPTGTRDPVAFWHELIGQVIERPAPRAAVVHQLRAIAAWTAAGRPAAIAAPTVVVHGELDELMPVGNGMRLARLVPGARYVELPGVGHLVPLEAPDPLADVIEEQ
jgi:pimeloyl-ACP methyl ester carboxylesterase